MNGPNTKESRKKQNVPGKFGRCLITVLQKRRGQREGVGAMKTRRARESCERLMREVEAAGEMAVRLAKCWARPGWGALTC